MNNVLTLHSSIPQGLRNLADAIENKEYDPKYLVWVIHEDDGLISGALGLCSDGDVHLLLAKAQRYLEGAYE